MLDFDNFEQIDFRVGTVLEVDEFPKARKPAFQLTIDFGHLGILKSSAQITTIYSIPELIGRQVVAVVNFPVKKIADFKSQCLVLGATQGNDVFLLSPQANLPNGQVVR
ncbi:tRNA-binding protein [Flavobacteriaceae bacterium]|jgi:tRNA-binding protein|nr:tRNA-binding protein [Flavobacteriaceae bacterium]MDA8924213.1 tRNA-binding protein [Flavobacteriaceae bacterium]MDA9245048.1 tRNA-binding protein [Flavobacteriaceae bacterium]MDA9984317.1 tRNA-binding protein [Flavobacteriaceae bacterium]MDB2672400.1 tRNA-binding protein [Flavobacteriaceae bacterium]